MRSAIGLLSCILGLAAVKAALKAQRQVASAGGLQEETPGLVLSGI